MKTAAGRGLLNSAFRWKHGSSAGYWEHRYKNNGTSGAGSYGEPALYKASVINQFVTDNGITSVIEFGCGDGNQLKLFHFPRYTGLDVSATAINNCRDIFKNDTTKQFHLYETGNWTGENYDLSLSLDVVYHLLENTIFEKYMRDLFAAAKIYVIIYSWEKKDSQLQHVRYREFNQWIQENIAGWYLHETIPNRQPIPACDFFIYKRRMI